MYDEGSFKDGEKNVFFLGKDEIESWLTLEAIVWMMDFWLKSWKKDCGAGKDFIICVVEGLRQKHERIPGNVGGVIVGVTKLESPIGLGFYNADVLSRENAEKDAAIFLYAYLLVNEEYELLAHLVNENEDGEDSF